MALTFVGGKPKKKTEIEQPATLQEALTAQSEEQIHIGSNLSGQVQELQQELQQEVTLVSTLPVSVVTEEASSEVLTNVDRYTELQEQIDAADISAQLKEQEGIKKVLQSIAKSDQFPANKKVQLYGTHHNYVEFSEQANTTKIVDKAGLIAAIGIDKYIELTDITLTNAKKVLSEGELEKFTTIMPGARTLKSVHKGS